MQILQLDVDSISYELIKPEIKIYEKAEENNVLIEDALVLYVSVESGDTEQTAEDAVKDAAAFMAKLKRKKIVIYPYAHLSKTLEKPERALEILNKMRSTAKELGLEVYSSPFGWNKKWNLSIKGHPMAEQSKRYGAGAATKAQGTTHTTHQKLEEKPVDLSIVKKSDWSGLPESDHRTIGERLDLYSFQEVSPGMVYWHPNGHTIFRELMKYIREKLEEYDYQEIATPAFANLALWHVSGHIDKYRENMYMFESAEGQVMGLKPMNCPSTIMIFKSRRWSYRDLPVRFADFDKLYRNEISGALTGLFRVREMTQDDAHIFATEDQIERELANILRLVKELYGKFDLEFVAKLSTMPDKHLGDEKLWKKATSSLEEALKENKIKYEVKEKEGAFYGPKIDFDVKDSMGREWQCATVQLDYQLPQRFGLEYTGEDGKQHAPVIIHRVIYGTLERFLGVLTEHLHGKFPTWLSPVQVRVITISEHSNKYAEDVYKKLREKHFRAELDISDKTLEYKIRDAKMMEINYTVVIGQKEQEAGTVSIRKRDGTQKMGVKLEDFAADLEKEIRERK